MEELVEKIAHVIAATRDERWWEINEGERKAYRIDAEMVINAIDREGALKDPAEVDTGVNRYLIGVACLLVGFFFGVQFV